MATRRNPFDGKTNAECISLLEQGIDRCKASNKQSHANFQQELDSIIEEVDHQIVGAPRFLSLIQSFKGVVNQIEERERMNIERLRIQKENFTRMKKAEASSYRSNLEIIILNRELTRRLREAPPEYDPASVSSTTTLGLPSGSTLPSTADLTLSSSTENALLRSSNSNEAPSTVNEPVASDTDSQLSASVVINEIQHIPLPLSESIPSTIPTPPPLPKIDVSPSTQERYHLKSFSVILEEKAEEIKQRRSSKRTASSPARSQEKKVRKICSKKHATKRPAIPKLKINVKSLTKVPESVTDSITEDHETKTESLEKFQIVPRESRHSGRRCSKTPREKEGVVVETSQVETIIDQTKKREEISDVASFVHNLEEPIEKEPSGEQLSNKEIENGIKDLERRLSNYITQSIESDFLDIETLDGSDPRVATCRGKLQNKRSKLNQEINKELRLRAGAENLFRATTNRKLKETVALELSFVNSNLQLLKEQLAELNSSVELYQGESKEPVMPMIPLGLKETKEIDFSESFKDFILEHYSEDGNDYENEISEFMNLRQAMRTPHRDNSGISLLFQYYNQLYFVERRFFPPERSLGIYFEWYDSLTGVPSCQRTVAFEKACVLFNMAAIYTQMGAKQDRLTSKGLDQAVDNFLRAAGTFTYIQENFTNAPSMDLAPHMMDMLIQLMLAQARECLFEKLELQSQDKRDVDISLDLAQEAAQVADVYSVVHNLISVPAVRDYVPYSWVALVQVKREHYAAIAHYHSAVGMLVKSLEELSSHTKRMLQLMHSTPLNEIYSASFTDEQRKQLGKAHLKSALLFHEEAHRILRLCRELRNKHFLSHVLTKCHERTSKAYANIEDDDDDFSEILDPPNIEPSSKFQLQLTPPDFAHLPVEDLFHRLGPVAIFSAKHHWTVPRSIQLQRTSSSDSGFGFSVRGDAPVIVAAVDPGSLAHFGGMKEGDFIVSISEKDVKWAHHEEVVKLIKEAGDSLTLKLVTPMDRNYLKPKNKNTSNGGTSSSNSSESGGTNSRNSTYQHSPSASITTQKKLTWNPFRKQKEKESPNISR